MLIEDAQSPRIDVFDFYLEQSIKNIVRSELGATEGTTFRHTESGHSVQPWRKLLSCLSKKKNSLLQVAVEEWKHEKDGKKFTGIDAYVTMKGKCYKIRQSGSKEAKELKTTQKEADTRPVFHARHAAKTSYQCLTIVSDDTDELVLAIAFALNIQC